MQGEVDQLAALAASLVEKATGGRAFASTRIPRGVMAHKFEVRTEKHGTYIARFYPPGRERVANYEPQLLVRAREAGALVPSVVAYANAGPISDRPYVLYSMLEGVPLDERLAHISSGELERVGRQICAQLKVLSSLEVSGFGGLLDGQTGEFPTWITLFRAAIENFRILDGARRAPALNEAVEALEEGLRPNTGPAEARLGWGDLSPDNIIVNDQSELVGLIDFEGVLAAEPILSLGYLKARHADTPFCATLDRAFRSEFGLGANRAPIYTVLRALRIWPYLSEPLPTGQPRMPLDEFLPGLARAVAHIARRASGPDVI